MTTPTHQVGRRTLELRTPPCERYVLDTWLRQYQRIAELSLDELDRHRRIAVDLFPLVRCAIDPGAPNTIHGWVCASPGRLHFVYVPSTLRREGIARWLVATTAGESGVATHRRPKQPKELRNVFPGFIYDPYALIDAVREQAEARGRRIAA